MSSAVLRVKGVSFNKGELDSRASVLRGSGFGVEVEQILNPKPPSSGKVSALTISGHFVSRQTRNHLREVLSVGLWVVRLRASLRTVLGEVFAAPETLDSPRAGQGRKGSWGVWIGLRVYPESPIPLN